MKGVVINLDPETNSNLKELIDYKLMIEFILDIRWIKCVYNLIFHKMSNIMMQIINTIGFLISFI